MYGPEYTNDDHVYVNGYRNDNNLHDQNIYMDDYRRSQDVYWQDYKNDQNRYRNEYQPDQCLYETDSRNGYNDNYDYYQVSPILKSISSLKIYICLLWSVDFPKCDFSC